MPKSLFETQLVDQARDYQAQATAAAAGGAHYALDKNNNPIPLSELRLPNGMQAIAGNGEINAYDKRGAFVAASGVQRAMASGQIRKHYSIDTEKTVPLFMRAVAGDAAAMQAIAAGATTITKEVNKREGFMRTVLAEGGIDGFAPRVSMPLHNQYAVVGNGAGSVGIQEVVDRVFQPQEFPINSAVSANGLEIQRNPGDLLGQMYDQSFESVQVLEDRTTMAATRMLGNLGVNDPIVVSGALTPRLLSMVINSPREHGLPPSVLLLAADLWTDLQGEPDFHSMFDPVTRFELVTTGRIATIFGATIITDGVRKDNQRVLFPGEMQALSQKEFVGSYTDRGGVEARPMDGTNNAADTRGWFLTEYLSVCCPNPRAVQVFRKV